MVAKEFLNELYAAIYSCEVSFDRGSPSRSLRIFDCCSKVGTFGDLSCTDAERISLVIDLQANRRERIRLADNDLRALSENARLGKMLFYRPDSSMFDGLAEANSDGFFDVNNCPPSECWVEFLTQERAGALLGERSCATLLAWIPSGATDFAENGVLADPSSSILFAPEHLVHRLLRPQ